MNEVIAALKEVAEFLEACGWRYALIGGIAVGSRGQPRTTNDVDISLWVELGDEPMVIQQVLSQFAARFEDAAHFARVARILVIEASNHVPIDLALASFPFEEEMIKRASRVEIQTGLTVNVLSAEDLIVSKAMASRPLDWFDIQGIFDRLGPKLDYAAIVTRLKSISELIDLETVVPLLEACHRKSNEL